tara:strand:- start:53308 stop:53559 length:252 start_codon:yes stop_codon:yes gene_type:complete
MDNQESQMTDQTNVPLSDPILTVNIVKDGHTTTLALPFPPSVPKKGDKFSWTQGEITKAGVVTDVHYHYYNGQWITTITVAAN